eukprot:CAMPEP_0174293242 /NCGR_PEP_ID=MMETSP0809-20121228/37960_1 /TAXON_ID=73025 ORGANISM="Eutreptiella gymnastica-like, Strain CCMP1594" /NCGR_SAMPLE_ID=MMETSP0809 /ASSEMBLY_ACC=CAM_ASM_000658 /LENGTH=256 /DNA_ID=CAMNT_0015393883 /DNA_START=155 /DNA_END=922 /DNA_ORIENTATION=+
MQDNGAPAKAWLKGCCILAGAVVGACTLALRPWSAPVHSEAFTAPSAATRYTAPTVQVRGPSLLRRATPTAQHRAAACMGHRGACDMPHRSAVTPQQPGPAGQGPGIAAARKESLRMHSNGLRLSFPLRSKLWTPWRALGAILLSCAGVCAMWHAYRSRSRRWAMYATAGQEDVQDQNGVDDRFPWLFDGRAWFRPALVRVAPAAVPGDAAPLALFGWTVGGVVCLEYDASPVGPYREYVTMGALVAKRGTAGQWG